MNCKNCGTILNATDKFCLSCGTPVDMPAPAAPVTPLVSPETVVNEQMPVQPLEGQTQQMVQSVQPVVQQQVEKGIAEYETTGLPVVQPKPEPVETTIPVGPSLSATELEQQSLSSVEVPMATPTPVIPGAPIAPLPGQVQPPQPEPKKDNKKLFIIIGGVVLVLVAVAVVLVLVLGKDKDASTDNDKKDNEICNKEPEKEEKPVVNNYKLKLGNFKYTIPNEYEVEVRESTFRITSDKYLIKMTTISPSDLSNATIEQVEAMLNDEGISATKSFEKIKDGNTYYVFRAYVEGIDTVTVLSKSTKNYFVMANGYKMDYSYGDDLVDEIIDIMEDTEYVPTIN